MERKLGHLADDLRQQDGGAHRISALGKGQKLLGEIPGSQRRPLRLLQVAFDRRQPARVEQRQRDVAHDRGQDVVEIMRDASGQDADRFEPRGPFQFLLEALADRDIPDHQHGPDDFAFRVVHRCAAAFDQVGGAIAAREPRLGRQIDQHAFLQHPGQGQHESLIRPRSCENADLRERPAHRLRGDALGQLLRGAVHEQHASPCIGGDHPFGHRAQRHRQALLLRGERRFRALEFGEIHQRDHRVLQLEPLRLPRHPPAQVCVVAPPHKVAELGLRLAVVVSLPDGFEPALQHPQPLRREQSRNLALEMRLRLRVGQPHRRLVYRGHPDRGGQCRKLAGVAGQVHGQVPHAGGMPPLQHPAQTAQIQFENGDGDVLEQRPIPAFRLLDHHQRPAPLRHVSNEPLHVQQASVGVAHGTDVFTDPFHAGVATAHF